MSDDIIKLRCDCTECLYNYCYDCIKDSIEINDDKMCIHYDIREEGEI